MANLQVPCCVIGETGAVVRLPSVITTDEDGRAIFYALVDAGEIDGFQLRLKSIFAWSSSSQDQLQLTLEQVLTKYYKQAVELIPLGLHQANELLQERVIGNIDTVPLDLQTNFQA